MASKSPKDIALESDIPPNTKSINKWCKDMGYRSGLHGFALSHGFKTYGSEYGTAARLVEQYRDEQQKEWEALRALRQESESKKRKRAELDENKKQLVKIAMLWHSRLGHTDYETVLRAPHCATGIPCLDGLQVHDFPACQICSEVASILSGLWHDVFLRLVPVFRLRV